MSSPPTAIEELPPLQDDRLYDADETSLYVKKSARWLKRAGGADEIQHTRVGRSVRWSAKNIRDITAGVKHTPSHGTSRSPVRQASRPHRAKAAALSAA
ncbi:hypothetical protein OG594_08650 [Streptomyces sp. NBC_01214]|uniref:hypothetical protein n=1 Tax=Streptomyces sp. NBC_01214 TaxID=2903777 RepID=UPI00225C2BF2|nr:hypothetical protein [Streptomyces sp. NBC_01214]MCX4801718.1 hypothetical protein [Streptomyces sp. NBC_01214]